MASSYRELKAEYDRELESSGFLRAVDVVGDILIRAIQDEDNERARAVLTGVALKVQGLVM